MQAVDRGILGIRIQKLSYMEAEKSLEAKLASKGVRLDIYVEDEDGVAYDVEMQVDDRYKEYLGERTRFYLSMMDNDSLKKGESYHKLRKSYIIFICLFDPFCLNLPKYTFTAHCDEYLDLKLDDGASRIFLNCNGDRHKTTKSLANLLDYIANGTVSDAYTATIENEVVNFREDDGKEKLFMTYQQTIMEERMFAREEERANMIINMLQAGISVEKIAEIAKTTTEKVKEICKL